MNGYPLTGFHFKAVFELSPQLAIDMAFQEISGLNVDVNLDSYTEGGENRFVHRVPSRTKYGDLQLKRGMKDGSGLTAWCEGAMRNFNYQPVNVTVSLLDEQHQPLMSWYVVNAIPIKYEIAGFNAEQGQVVIESLTLGYQYYNSLDLAAAATPQQPVAASGSGLVINIAFP